MKTQRWTSLFSLGLLIIGIIGYFSLNRDLWLFYVFAHVGALGVIGLLAGVAGFVAKKKQRSYWKAFVVVTVSSIVSGLIAVLILFAGEEGQLYCGGTVSLAVAIVLIILYLFMKKKASLQGT
jgi:peptidoglycan/LPS O-acetylase OafA/YrhL